MASVASGGMQGGERIRTRPSQSGQRRTSIAKTRRNRSAHASRRGLAAGSARSRTCEDAVVADEMEARPRVLLGGVDEDSRMPGCEAEGNGALSLMQPCELCRSEAGLAA